LAFSVDHKFIFCKAIFQQGCLLQEVTLDTARSVLWPHVLREVIWVPRSVLLLLQVGRSCYYIRYLREILTTFYCFKAARRSRVWYSSYSKEVENFSSDERTFGILWRRWEVLD